MQNEIDYSWGSVIKAYCLDMVGGAQIVITCGIITDHFHRCLGMVDHQPYRLS